ncbi:MAG: hypothetical protein IPH20_21315 [Bacteroidales bacterium]|nr:hypothetical protein [Bacteroidales bacterium]
MHAAVAGDVKNRLQVVDAATGSMKHTFEGFEAINFTVAGDTAFVLNFRLGYHEQQHHDAGFEN